MREEQEECRMLHTKVKATTFVQVKKLAAERGTHLNRVVNELLKKGLKVTKK